MQLLFYLKVKVTWYSNLFVFFLKYKQLFNIGVFMISQSGCEFYYLSLKLIFVLVNKNQLYVKIIEYFFLISIFFPVLEKALI